MTDVLNFRTGVLGLMIPDGSAAEYRGFGVEDGGLGLDGVSVDKQVVNNGQTPVTRMITPGP